MRLRVISLLLLVAVLVSLSARAEDKTQDPGTAYTEAIRLLLEGRADEARVALENIAVQSPEHAGAWLDLAILQCGLGHTSEAMALFDAIETRFSPPPAIRQVIAQQRGRGCRLDRPEGHVRLRAGRGWDTNVNQGASNPNFSIGSGSGLVSLVLAPEFSPARDSLTTLSAEVSQPMPSLGVNFFGQFQSRRYDNLSRYDLHTLTAALEHPWQQGGWEFAAVGLASLTTLGPRLYQDRLQAQLRVLPPVELPVGWKLGMTASATQITYPTLRGYDATQLESYAWLAYINETMVLRLSGGYNSDHAGGQRAGGDRSSVFANFNGRVHLGGGLFADFDWARQRWNDERAYSPGLIDLRRRQETKLMRAGVYLPVSQGHGVYVEYRDTQNGENISIFEYKSQLLQASWQWDFPL